MEHQKQLQGGLVAELETRMMEEAEEEEREQAEEEGRMEARVRELQLHAEVFRGELHHYHGQGNPITALDHEDGDVVYWHLPAPVQEDLG